MEYQFLSNDRKVNVFDAVLPVMNTLHTHFTGTNEQLFFSTDASIVDPIIRNQLFDSEAEDETIERVLNVFKLMAAANDEGILRYDCRIKHLKLFKLVTGQLVLDSSSRLASRQIVCVREELLSGYLTGCNESVVTRFDRASAAACLQNISEVFKSVWAFFVAFESASVECSCYFDVPVVSPSSPMSIVSRC